MPQHQDTDQSIWAREDVIVTSAREPQSGRRIHLVKVLETEEIFELGEPEYRIWKEFEGGRSLVAVEGAVAARLGDQYSDNLRRFVAELAMRGLLYGAPLDEIVDEFSEDPVARQLRLRYPIEPDGRELIRPYNRILLFDPNEPFAALARCFWFVKYLVWPIVFASIVAGLLLIKHFTELSQDFPPTVLSAYGIPHGVFTLFTINLTRIIVMGAVIRHYGARMRFFSLDFKFGIWPRFHVDKRGMLRLRRTPQLWSHSSPFFVRLAFFSGGAFGWWWFRENGSILSQLFLLVCQAGAADMACAAQPLFKNETYYWMCVYFEEPYLNERAVDALRRVFRGQINPLRLPQQEKAALVIYAGAILFSILLCGYIVITMFARLTGNYRGVGLASFLGLCGLFSIWFMARRARARRQREAHDDRRSVRRTFRRTIRREPELAPLEE